MFVASPQSLDDGDSQKDPCSVILTKNLHKRADMPPTYELGVGGPGRVYSLKKALSPCIRFSTVCPSHGLTKLELPSPQNEVKMGRLDLRSEKFGKVICWPRTGPGLVLQQKFCVGPRQGIEL